MFGISKAIYRGALREPMIRKRGHNYYKGSGVGSTGRYTKHGLHILDPKKVRHYVVPDLEGFELTPYVSHRTPKELKLFSEKDFFKKN